MKKIYSLVGIICLSLVSFGQNVPIDFENGGFGESFTWTVFENGGASVPALEIVANPNSSGTNTSAMVAKYTAKSTLVSSGGFFPKDHAGVETQRGADIGTFTLKNSNAIFKMMVYKSKISPVGLKLVTNDGGSRGIIQVSNTVTNAWEELTFDFSSFIDPNNNIGTAGRPYVQLVVFPDLESRTSDAIIYFDNVTTENNGVVEPCVEGTSNMYSTVCTSYTSPSGKIFTTSGIYKDTLFNASVDGCDSIITINLTVNQIVNYGTSVVSSLCSPYYSAPSGTQLTTSGVYQDTIFGAGPGGCGVVRTIDLTLHVNQQAVTIEPLICSGTSTTVDLASSEQDVAYTLFNNSDFSVIDGPVVGTGGLLSLQTGNLTSSKSYVIRGEKQSSNRPANDSALYFDGWNVDQKVSLGTDLWTDNYVGTDQFTVEAWVNRTNYNSFNTIIGNYEGGNYAFLFRLESGTATLYLNSSTAVSGGFIPINQWVHVAATYDGATVKLYVNGSLAASAAFTGTLASSTNEIKIGGGLSNLTENFYGSITDVHLWTVARTQQEISDNYLLQLSGTETDLLAYYQLSEGSGTAIDNLVTGNAYPGTAIGNLTWKPVIGHSVCAVDMMDLVTVSIALPLQANVSVTNTNICNGTADGAASISLTNGVPPYSYSWSNGATTGTVSELVANNYLVTINDKGNCNVLNEAITITELDPFVSTVSVTKSELCSGETDGAATVSVTGGETPYAYHWSNGATTNSVSGLDANNYFIAIIDNKNCDVLLETITITELSPMVMANASSTVICKDSLVTLYGSGASTYVWDNGITDNTATTLPVGETTLNVTGTDANGCTNMDAITVRINAYIAGDINCSGSIDGTEIAGDIDGDGAIGTGEVAGDTNGDGTIGTGEVLGDIDGDGIISGEVEGDANGNGILDGSEISSIAELADAFKFSVYPNPATNQISIVGENIPTKVELLNVEGRILITETNTNKLNISHVANGMYFVRINNTQVTSLIIAK